MTGFILVAVLVLLCVVAVLIRPLLVPRLKAAPEARPALRILREQREELDAELAAGRISAAEHAETLAEIEARAADEMQAVIEPDTHHKAWRPALALGVILPVAAVAIYLVIGQPEALDPAKTAPQQTFSAQDISAMVDGLAARVRANPDDLEAARMLARSYMVLERFKEAVAVYAALAPRLPDDAQLYADWADALGSANGNSMQGEPEKLVARALALDANNVKALALAGGLAFERHDYVQAQALWTRMSQHVDPASEMGRSAQAMLGEVARRIAAGTEAPSASAPAPATAGGLAVSGEVTLAPALQDAVTAGQTVFVFVRPVGGGMPVAALRLTAGQWPLQFDFAQAPLMAGEAAAGRYEVVARVSRQGNAAPASGDLEGISAPLQMPAGAKLQFEISRQLP